MFSFLAEGMYNTFDDLTKKPDSLARADKRYHVVDPFPEQVSMERQIQQSKNMLLYYPAVTVSDPLAKLSWPIIQVANLTGRVVISDEGKLRSEIREALYFFAGLKSLFEDGSALLFADSFFIDNPKLQEDARNEIRGRADRAEIEADPAKQMLVDGITLQGLTCKHLELMPLTTTDYAREALDDEYLKAAKRNVAKVELRMAKSLIHEHLPGADTIDADLIADLRHHDSAFASWRIAFQDVIERASREAEGDEGSFEREMKQASRDILGPKVKETDKALKASPVLTNIFKPAFVTLSGAALTAHFAGALASPTAALSASVSAALVPASWIIERLYTRYNKSGRSNTVLRDVYTHLILP
jgi:hypothetical protein